MKRVFERKEPEESSVHDRIIERIKIGVTGCGSSAGTSFIATSLAYYAAHLTERNVAYVQLDGNTGAGNSYLYGKSPKCDVYDALGMDKRFAGRTFTDFFSLIKEGRSIKGMRNPDERINWALEVPEAMRAGRKDKLTLNESDISCTLDAMRLVNNITGDFIVCDFGKGDSIEGRSLYEDMDYIVAVIDPLPSKLLGNSGHISLIKSLEMRGRDVIWIINKDNPGVNRRELRDFLGSATSDKYRKIPLLDERLIYSCQYNCEIPASHREIRRQIEPLFAGIITVILE